MRSILRNHRYRRDARTLEDEEEMWFNTDEDDMEDGEAVVPPSDKSKNDDDIMDPISKFMERKKCKYLEEKQIYVQNSSEAYRVEVADFYSNGQCRYSAVL